MAVQTHQPSNVQLLKRNEVQDMKVPPPCFGIESPVVLFPTNADGGNVINRRKRGREAMMPLPSIVNPLPQTTRFVTVDQLQAQPYTKLGLSLECQNHCRASISDELAAQFHQQTAEIDQLLCIQSEQLRRTIAERGRRYYSALLAAAEASAARRIREKQVELDRTAARSAELERQLARLAAESIAWQARAAAAQATAADLHARLQMAAAECAEDAGSVCVDPAREEPNTRPAHPCRACRTGTASVVVLPCRHLCLCLECDVADGPRCCPVCESRRTGSVQVLLS